MSSLKPNPNTDNICTLCSEKPIDCIYITCGHAGCCLGCAGRCTRYNEQTTCPYCRCISPYKKLFLMNCLDSEPLDWAGLNENLESIEKMLSSEMRKNDTLSKQIYTLKEQREQLLKYTEKVRKQLLQDIETLRIDLGTALKKNDTLEKQCEKQRQTTTELDAALKRIDTLEKQREKQLQTTTELKEELEAALKRIDTLERHREKLRHTSHNKWVPKTFKEEEKVKKATRRLIECETNYEIKQQMIEVFIPSETHFYDMCSKQDFTNGSTVACYSSNQAIFMHGLYEDNYIGGVKIPRQLEYAFHPIYWIRKDK